MTQAILLNQFDTVTGANEGAKVFLLDKSGEKTEFFIKVAGVDSDTFRKAEREVASKRLAMSKKRRGKDPSMAQLEELDLTLLAAATLEWNLMDNEGKDFPCSRDNAMAVYRGTPEIRRQVEGAIVDDTNFTKAS